MTDQLNGQAQRVRNDNKNLESQLGATRSVLKQDQTFATAAEPLMVQGQLPSESVAVVSAPGVSDSARSALEKTLTTAGDRKSVV